MVRLPGSSAHPTTACAILLLCFCVFMQLLGTTMTLWDLELELDPVKAPLLEGFSLPVFSSDLQPSGPATAIEQEPERSPYLLYARSLFRPPNPSI